MLRMLAASSDLLRRSSWKATSWPSVGARYARRPQSYDKGLRPLWGHLALASSHLDFGGTIRAHSTSSLAEERELAHL